MEWADKVWVQSLPPNIYRTPAESLQAFDYVAENSNHFNEWQRIVLRYAGAAFLFTMWQIKSYKRGIKDKRQYAYDAANTWADAVGSRKFMGMMWTP